MKSLRARVTLAAVVATALVCAVSGAAVVTAYALVERNELDEILERDQHDAAHAGMSALHPDADPERDRFETPASEQIWQVYVRGKLALADHGVHVDDPMPPTEPGASFVEHEGRRYRVYSEPSPIIHPAVGRPRVQVARPTAQLDARVARVRWIVLIAGVLGTLLVAFPARWLAGVALRPLPELRDAARGISSTRDLGTRLSDDGPEEVAEVAWALNHMLERLQEQVTHTEAALQATRTFTADAGHELRTPLTSLRANLDVLARDGLDPQDRERSLREALGAHARLTALIDALQVLARGDAAVGHRPERLDLAELVDAVVMEARRRHPDTAFDIEAAAELPVDGDPHGLRMLFENLVENAARHGGSRVRVTLRRGPAYVRASVEDDGPGIPDAEKPRVFERFARGSQARNGTGSGLGLAIAAQQARLHDGRLDVFDSESGGALFELVLSAPSSS